MQSIIVISEDTEAKEKYIDSLCGENRIAPADRLRIDTKGMAKTALSIGIERIHGMKETLYLRPMQSSVKAILITEGDMLTVEAQNALLKILEEPPEFVLCIIGAKTKESLLPTIRSRCKIVVLTEKVKTVTPEKTDEIRAVFLSLPNQSIADALSLAETVAKNRGQAIEWLNDMVKIGRDVLLEDVHGGKTIQSSKHTLYVLQKTHRIGSQSNANIRLLLESCFFSIRKNS